tara:strand:- start:28093 stop:28617 length:525 start_codon:yes stop_codon:yes gene_type:complete
MKIMTTGLLGIALLLLGVSAGSADANTNRRFPGQNCQPDYGAYSTVDLHSDGYTSKSSSSKLAWCPITGYRTNTVDYDAAYFYVYDAISDGEVSCQMFVKTLTGTSYAGVSETSGLSNTGRITMIFTGSELPNNGAAVYSVVGNSFYCTVPGDSPANPGAYSNLRGYVTNTVYN